MPKKSSSSARPTPFAPGVEVGARDDSGIGFAGEGAAIVKQAMANGIPQKHRGNLVRNASEAVVTGVDKDIDRLARRWVHRRPRITRRRALSKQQR